MYFIMQNSRSLKEAFDFYSVFLVISDFFFSLSFSFVLKELIQTERDYVKSLGEVVEVSNLG